MRMKEVEEGRPTFGQGASQSHTGREDALKGWDVHIDSVKEQTM